LTQIENSGVLDFATIEALYDMWQVNHITSIVTTMLIPTSPFWKDISSTPIGHTDVLGFASINMWMNFQWPHWVARKRDNIKV
jgi:hypothetical protein